MRMAMAEAEVGDDVFGEDPTVLRLQETVARLLGKEASLFVPSGSMSNQLALRAHTEPGDEVICETGCHIANYEAGAAGALSGVQLQTIQGVRGIIQAEQVTLAIRHGYYWEPRPRLVCLENTHNKAGGTVYPQSVVRNVGEAARSRGLAFHLDGARIWNASVAGGLSLSELAQPFDTISVCLSKGLGAPIGSLLVGPEEFIVRAHRFRKMFGGGMRQVGILAAAGLYALEHHMGDLAADHRRARVLAKGLARFSRVALSPDSVETNILMFDVSGAPAIETLAELKGAGILMVPFGPATIRATTHRDLSDSDINDAIAAAAPILDR